MLKEQTGEDWQDCLDNFKACSDINGWDDEFKCNFIGLRLKDTVYKVYEDLEEGVKITGISYVRQLRKDWKQ